MPRTARRVPHLGGRLRAAQLCADGGGAGAAPASLLRSALNALVPGGLLAFTLNDAAMAQESCKTELKTVLDDNLAVELFSEYGPHLSSINIGSTVYILERI